MSSLLVYFIPAGVLLLASSALEQRRVVQAMVTGTAAFAIVVICYVVIGFGIQFGGVGLVSNTPGFQLLDQEWSPLQDLLGPGWGVAGLGGVGLSLGQYSFEVLNLLFVNAALAATAVIVPVLALAAGVRSRILLVGAAILGLVIFPSVGNWVWGGGWLSQLGNTVELGHGLVDYAGSAVVFIFAGSASLGGLLGFGLRSHTNITTAANIPEFPSARSPLLLILGSVLFIFGMVAFATSNPLWPGIITESTARLNLLSAAVSALLVAVLYGWFVTGELSIMLAARGSIAGVVAVAASLPLIPGWAAIAIGAGAGALVPVATFIVDRWLRADDQALTVSTFGASGIWGMISLAIFADGQYGIGWNKTGVTTYLGVANQGVTGIFASPGFVPDSPGQMEAQFFGVLIIGLFVFIVSWVLFYALRLLARSPESP